MQMVPAPCRIYRIVHIDNLDMTLGEAGIWCGNEMLERELKYKQIGLQGLTADRGAWPITSGPSGVLSTRCPGGVLNDYVPFYFGTYSVMLYNIHTGRVPTYQEGQSPIIHLVSSVETLVRNNLDFVFSDRHAKVKMASFFDDPAHLGNVSFDIIGARNFSRDPSDSSKLERYQAEFLAHRFVPWNCIKEVTVFNKTYLDDAKELIEAYGYKTPVRIATGDYF